MGFKFKFNGFDVECDTAAEVVALLECGKVLETKRINEMASSRASELIADEFVDLLRRHGKEVGEDLVSDLNAVAEYAAQRVDHLSRCASEPGFREALIAERDNVAMRAALRTVARADDLDARILAITETALQIGARVLAAAIVVA